MNHLTRYVLVFVVLAAVATFASRSQPANAAAELAPRPGWVILTTEFDFPTLTARVIEAAKVHKIVVVNRASASIGARRLFGETIPGNMVFGLYHPRFATRTLDASIAAGIEAPLRLYVTENSDSKATLSYKTPSHVFAPYMEEGGDKLKELAAELDTLFAALAKDAAGK